MRRYLFRSQRTTMIVFIVLLACASAHATTYVKPLEMFNHVVNLLDINVMSMAGNVPLQDDPRRQYAEVVHVVCTQASHLSACMQFDYEDEYPIVLNATAGTGIVNPQLVINHIQSFLDKVMAKTKNIRDLVGAQCKNVRPNDCDVVIDKEVNSDPKRYKKEAEILQALGKMSLVFIDMQPQLQMVCKNHAAHKYVIEGKKLLKEVVKATALVKTLMSGLVC